MSMGMIIVLCVGGLVLIVAAVAIRRVRRTISRLQIGRPVAETEAQPTEPFSFQLDYDTEWPGSWQLFARLRLQGAGQGGTSVPSSHLGLTCHLRVTADDRVLFKEVLGFESELSEQVDRHVDTHSWSDVKFGGGQVDKEGSFLLEDLPRLPAGTHVQATGHFVHSSGTNSSMLKLFLTPTLDDDYLQHIKKMDSSTNRTA